MSALPSPLSLSANGVSLGVHFFCTVRGNPGTQLHTLQPYLARMPAPHLVSVARATIVVVEKLPGGRPTGGGFFTSFLDWMGRERKTGIPDSFFAFRPRCHIIAITRRAFDDADTRPFTFFHESAHCIHRSYPIYPHGATFRDYAGIRYTRSNAVEEYAAETYSRYIVNPRRIARVGEVPIGQSMQECTRRLIEQLMASPAGRHFRQMNQRGSDADGDISPMPYEYPW
ncbi:hypothetical protein CLV84_1738 [Neolewinella xylanilytica]|uniref:Uncharacterized protein n=1 Tax=Neolewinella xylanilytica TaxID=1514080 RepID=A0A2S6IB75_9BACT|nr:hypothetical protein [Neolewinella xylanilytica]PPK88767.1 hypothetical protein CLV84_1738 [Neolewinella xylanilytica]